jgi:hypothetical protein
MNLIYNAFNNLQDRYKELIYFFNMSNFLQTTELCYIFQISCNNLPSAITFIYSSNLLMSSSLLLKRQ